MCRLRGSHPTSTLSPDLGNANVGSRMHKLFFIGDILVDIAFCVTGLIQAGLNLGKGFEPLDNMYCLKSRNN